MKYLWENLRWPEFNKLDKENMVVIVPIGSIEQHGPHLPISTDTKLVTEVVTRTAKQLGGKILVTPTVWTGFSPHHMDFPGAISLSSKVLLDLLLDICNSIYHHGFKRILLINGHGGNSSFLRITSARMGNKPDCIVAALNYWDLVKDYLYSVIKDGQEFIPGHAGEFETSLQLVLSKDLVESSLISKVEATTKMLSSRSGSNLYVYRPTKSLSSNGQLGSSENSSVEQGEIILKKIIQELKKFIIDFSTWDIDNI